MIARDPRAVPRCRRKYRSTPRPGEKADIVCVGYCPATLGYPGTETAIS